MIYFAQIETGAIKIGTTEDLAVRLSQLEVHYGKSLELLATVPGGVPEEREIHRRFKHLRFGLTEQFRPTAELMEFIGKPFLVGVNPDAVEAVKPRHAKICIYLDSRLVRCLKRERAETDRPVSEIINRIVARHYGIELPDAEPEPS